MKTNLLAQNDDLVIENLKADVGKSVMNLSHSVTFPIDVDGAILPICCIETLPSDSFEIRVECLLRQLSPLKVPLMTSLRLNTAFYYCDNRLAWKKWDRFMTGGRSGNEVYDIPRVYNAQKSSGSSPRKYTLADSEPSLKINYKNCLHTYFGICFNHDFSEGDPEYSDFPDDSNELPLAFPFFDYQIICRDYYTNVDRLADSFQSYTDFDDIDCDWAYDNLFPSDDDEIRLVDGIQRHSGFQSGDDSVLGNKGFILDKVRYHDVRPDYFTTSKKAPMRGQAPALSAQSKFVLPSGTILTFTEDSLKLKANTKFSESGTAPFTDKQFNLRPVPGEVAGDTGITGVTSNLDSDQGVYTGDKFYVGSFADDSLQLEGNITLNGLLQSDWTAADIRLLSQLSVWQELNMLHKPYYDDFLNAHFDNVRVGESPVEKAQYIGGTSQLISINEILQTSATSDSSYLGNQGATAMSLADNYVGRYYSNNYGYIIGVAYIIPEMLYKPALPRHFSRRVKEDYYSPEFANLSMQATLNKEIFFSNDDEWNNGVWGYTGAYDELRSIPNRIAGDLINPSYTDLQKWTLNREMDNDNLPSMSHKWISLKDNVDKTAWQVMEMPAFILQCANYIKAVRPMPKIAIPKAL